MRPGRAVMTTISSPSRMASSMACVTNRMVLRSARRAQQFLLHDDLGLGVECGERLVHQQDRAPHDQRAGQRDAAGHAAESCCGMVLETAQADGGDMSVRAFSYRSALGDTGHLQAEGDVVDHVPPGKQVECCQTITNAVPSGADAPPTARPRLGADATHNLNQRTLAAAARSENASELLGRKPMRNVVERQDLGGRLAEDLDEVVDDDLHQRSHNMQIG